MKATVTTPKHDSRVRQNRKENHFVKEITAIIIPEKKSRIPAPWSQSFVTLRIYHTDRQAYACLWAHNAEGTISINGGGKAGGYGYHRASQAAECAFNNAGVTLDQGIGGAGDEAMREAVEALAKALTDKPFIIHTAHP